jgi:peroxiredoxin
MTLMPRRPVPALELATLDGSPARLPDPAAEHFSMAVFYRGYHCPLCRRYLTELDGMMQDFAGRGVSVVVASADTRDRAEQARSEWKLEHMNLAYGLPLGDARAWGLYISTSRGKTSLGIEEPPRFSEPGLFLIRTDGTLYWSNVSTMPFARPHFTEILAAIDFALKHDYPARGEA